MESILNFLQKLRENNNKEWFDKNRTVYLDTKQKFLAITEMLNNEIRQFDASLPLEDPKKFMFRIFRDVRFSKDKRPYKTNYGSFLVPGGRKSPGAGYYIHLEPDACFVGGGIYMPPGNILQQIRSAIYQTPEELLEIVNSQEFKKHYGELWGEQLKTAPRGFPKDWEHIDLLRYKSFIGSKPFTTKEVLSANFLEKAVESFRALYPLNRYLNDVLREG